MKQQIYVNGIYEYDYELIDDNIHTLYYSISEHWTSTIRGEIAFAIEDDGNGFNLLTKFNDKKKLDFSESECLYILLRITHHTNTYEIGTKKIL
jgi:hypothetical protein